MFIHIVDPFGAIYIADKGESFISISVLEGIITDDATFIQMSNGEN